MKKIIFLFAFSVIRLNLCAQNNTNSILIRHDTVMLKAEECKWIISKATPGKSVPGSILDAIETGKLKAIDPLTQKPIPAKDIYTWKMPADSMMTHDKNGNEKIGVIQHKRSADHINLIRIYSDWYLNTSTGKLFSMIGSIELMEDIYSSFGDLLGHSALCSIYY